MGRGSKGEEDETTEEVTGREEGMKLQNEEMDWRNIRRGRT